MKEIIVDRDEVIGPWVARKTGGTWYKGRGVCIGLVNDGQLIAGALYEDHNGAQIMGHVAAEGKHWLNKEFLWFCFYYPFKQLNCKRITGVIASTNLASIRFHEHLGFVHEATLKNAHPDGDLLVYVMWPENCRWLTLKEDSRKWQKPTHQKPPITQAQA